MAFKWETMQTEDFISERNVNFNYGLFSRELYFEVEWILKRCAKCRTCPGGNAT